MIYITTLLLISLKARRQFEEDIEEFNRRKLKHNTHIAEIERQEILRREDTLTRITDRLNEMRRKHRCLENVFESQVNKFYI